MPVPTGRVFVAGFVVFLSFITYNEIVHTYGHSAEADMAGAGKSNAAKHFSGPAIKFLYWLVCFAIILITTMASPLSIFSQRRYSDLCNVGFGELSDKFVAYLLLSVRVLRALRYYLSKCRRILSTVYN